MTSETARPASLPPQSGGSSATVFAKHWTPGLVKTRLATDLGEERAAVVARLMLETTLDRLSSVEAALTIAFTPDEQQGAFQRLAGNRRCRLEPQPRGDLGERMRLFCERSRSRGEAAILLGADSPDLPLGEVERAIEWLAGSVRCVIGPSDDGGYWMLGVRGEPPPILEGMPWGESGLLEATLRRLDEAGWRRGRDYELARRWYDVDTPDDLARLRRGLRTRGIEDPPLARLATELSCLLDG